MSSRLVWDTAASPFAPVIGTNYAPSLVELVKLKAALVEPQQELYRLESEIAHVQAILDGLLSEKRVEAYIEAHEALMSPIRQIPSETLAEIFMQCLPLDSGYGLRSLKYAPLLMTRICRDWQRIAIETPRLWGSLHIYFPPHLSQDAAFRRIAGVKLWLQRTGSVLPISISLHTVSGNHHRVVREDAQRSPNMATSMMKSLLRFHDRIRRMYLALDRPDMMEFCELLPVDSSFPQLASLKIQDRPDPLFWRLELIERVPDIGTLLSRMPLLRSFEIGPLTGQSDLQYRALPCRWEILTNISIQDFLTPTDLLGILAQSRALKTVESSLSISGPSFPSESSFPTAVLVNLTTLRLKISLNLYHGPFGIGREETERRHSQCLVHISAIISRIICSSLKSLHVSIYSARPAIASSQLPIRSLPLHELEILGLEMPMTPQAFTECLELVPNLISFDFVNAGDTLEDFHLVTLTPSSNNPLPLCPQLRHFRMMDRRTDAGSSHHWSIQNLTEFIAGRHKDKMLDSCDLFFPESPSFTEEQIQLLRKLKEDGLKLRVHHYRASQPEIITGYIDEPTSGLINHGHGPTSLSDMNDTFDTEIIV